MKDSNVIISILYPEIEKRLKIRSNHMKFMNHIARYFNQKHEQIHNVAPYTNIIYNQSTVDDLFMSIGISEKEVESIISNCFFWDIGYSPLCAKTPYVEVLMCAIFYYVRNNDMKSAELTAIYTCFSGKFYASLYTNSWKKFAPNRQVMDFVVNNMLSDKFDLKKEGTLFKAVKKLCQTWLNTYANIMKSKTTTDDNVGKLIQQLRDRLKSMIINIANLYYEAYENKYYLNYEYDSIDPDDFHITVNDATVAARITESTINLMTSQKVNLLICRESKNENMSAEDLSKIMEDIIAEKENLPIMRRVINIIICDFMASNPEKQINTNTAEFISYSLKPKPNTKNPLILELKDKITKWLTDNSDYAFKKRLATKNNYYKAVLKYIVLMICKAALK